MKIPLKAVIWKEGDFFVAQCLNVEVSSFGESKEDALKNLQEAVSLYFEDMAIQDAIQIENLKLSLPKQNMPKLYSSLEIIKVLQKNGFVFKKSKYKKQAPNKYQNHNKKLFLLLFSLPFFLWCFGFIIGL